MESISLDTINIIGFIITTLMGLIILLMAKATYEYFKETNKDKSEGSVWFKTNTKDFLTKLLQYSFIGLGFIKTTELLFFISTPGISPFVVVFFFASLGGGLSLLKQVM